MANNTYIGGGGELGVLLLQMLGLLVVATDLDVAAQEHVAVLVDPVEHLQHKLH